MKKSLLLTAAILFVATTFTSCTTLANRRDLYSPEGIEGPYTKEYKRR